MPGRVVEHHAGGNHHGFLPTSRLIDELGKRDDVRCIVPMMPTRKSAAGAKDAYKVPYTASSVNRLFKGDETIL